MRAPSPAPPRIQLGRAQAQSAHPGPLGPRARSSRVTRLGVPPTLQLSPALPLGTSVGGGRGSSGAPSKSLYFSQSDAL